MTNTLNIAVNLGIKRSREITADEYAFNAALVQILGHAMPLAPKRPRDVRPRNESPLGTPPVSLATDPQDEDADDVSVGGDEVVGGWQAAPSRRRRKTTISRQKNRTRLRQSRQRSFSMADST